MKRFALFILSIICLNSFGQKASESWKDVSYADDSQAYHTLDIYLPEVEKPSYPVVIAVYGSAWFSNDLKGSVMQSVGNPLLEAGFAVIAPNHRSSADARFPAQINDVKAVVRFIKANAKKYKIDDSFIGITGFSSGGHLSALTGTSGGVQQITVGSASVNIEGDVGPNTSFGSDVDAVVDWFGPTDFTVMDSCGCQMAHNPANSPESSLIGGAIQENKDMCALANPITYVDVNDPPFLILHGDKDPLVPHCNSEMLFEALQKAGVQAQFVLVPDGGHGPGLFQEKYYKMMIDFFNKVIESEN
ncbi:MAG: alpha/beta hydrolase [Prolixibacteraceae bacterium]|nr:alpha/beta hydrolase [Prolixibacteraceae bacterium]